MLIPQRVFTVAIPVKTKETKRRAPAFIPFVGRRTTTSVVVAIAVITTVLLYPIQNANSATQFSSITASEESCSMSSNGFQCTIEQTTTLSLLPSNQQATLLIKTADSKPIGTFKIRVNEIAVECQKSSQFFTRSYVIQVQSVKRCPKAGSCVGDACAKTNFSTLERMLTST